MKAAAQAQYEVVIQTAAGQDASKDVALELWGRDGLSTGLLRLEQVTGGPPILQQGGLDVFVLDAAEVGEVTSVHLQYSGSSTGPAWLLSALSVTDLGSSQTWHANIDGWLDIPCGAGPVLVQLQAIRAPGTQSLEQIKALQQQISLQQSTAVQKSMESLIHSPCLAQRHSGSLAQPQHVSQSQPLQLHARKQTQYKLAVLTSDIVGAGTTAKITVQLFGDEGVAGPLCLGSGAEGRFVRGSLDQVTLDGPAVGRIASLHVCLVDEVGH